MDNSEFSQPHRSIDSAVKYAEVKQLSSHGATCETFKVRIYGKLHFLKRPHNISDTRLQAAFRKEFELGFNLEHPGIVRYVSFDTDKYGIFTEWIEGVTLTRFIADNPHYFNNKNNLDRFICQLLDAIQYLHNHSVIHLDLKPDNIMITDIDKSVKIIDLGFAVSDCFDSTPGLTPQFASPEQINHTGNIDCRTDIYAIGRIVEYIFAQTDTPPHRRYRKFIYQCTASDPDNRPATASQAQLLLQSHRQNTPIYITAIITTIIIALLVFYTDKGNDIDNTKLPSTTIDTTNIKIDTVNTPTQPIVKNIEPQKETTELSPAERLDTAEASMGWFVAIRGHYDLKKEWYARQYHVFDSLRNDYLQTDTAQRLGNRLNFVINTLIEQEKEAVARLFPNEDMTTIITVGQDISRVIIYLCYSDPRLFTDTEKMSRTLFDYAHRKATLIK